MSPEPAPDLPDEVKRLGTPLEELAFPRHWLLFNVLAAIPIFLFGALFVAMWVLFTVKVGGRVAWPFRAVVNVLILGVGVFLMLAAVVVPLRLYRSKRGRVLIYPEGLLRLGAAGPETLFWDEVAVIRQRMVRDARRAVLLGERHVTVERADGSTLHLDDVVVPRLRRLTVLMQQKSLPHLLPRALRALHAGEKVPLGVLSATAEGLQHGRRLLPWQEVAGARVNKSGTITIRRRGWLLAWWSGPVTRVDNVHVLLALAAIRPAFPRPRPPPDCALIAGQPEPAAPARAAAHPCWGCGLVGMRSEVDLADLDLLALLFQDDGVALDGLLGGAGVPRHHHVDVRLARQQVRVGPEVMHLDHVPARLRPRDLVALGAVALRLVL
jgi:hypothetical protein